jgi:tetratricopeptide (TPR) repeat protein
MMSYGQERPCRIVSSEVTDVLDPEQLLIGVQRNPSAAIAEGMAMLDADPSPRHRVIAMWTIGMAHRELGELHTARDTLERAWEAAIELDDAVMASHIAVSLSLVVAFQGELENALHILDVSEPLLPEQLRGRLRTQRGVILYEQGDFAASLEQYETALALLAESGDGLGELRQRINLGALHSYLGRLDDARAHLELALAQAEQLDQTMLQAVAEQNLAHTDTLAGDLPRAFESFERAARRYERSGYDGPFAHSLRLDHARALLHANLLSEATQLADRAVKESEETEGSLDLAESLMVAAETHLAAGDVAAATALAERSEAEFADRGRPAWATLARAVLLRARAADGPAPGLIAETEENAAELLRQGYRLPAARAGLLAAELRIGEGDVAGAERLTSSIASSASASLLDEVSVLRIRALIALGRDRRAEARRTVNRGVRLLAEHQAVLGAIELRAHAAANSNDLARIGLRLAIDDHRPRELLAHLEATRRTVSLLPAARPPDDEVLAELLTELRVVAAQQRAAIEGGSPDGDLARRRRGLEERIRGHLRQAPAGPARQAVPLAESVRLLGERTLVEYANLDGRLYAVSVVDNRTSLHDLGQIDELVADIDGCSHALHRLNRAQGSTESRAAAATALGVVTGALCERLVPRRVLRSQRPVVVVPTGVLYALPWGALPGLTGRAVSVCPSLTGWAVAHRDASSARSVGLIAGPDLEHADAEVTALAELHDRPDVLTGHEATAERSLALIGRCNLAHVACHGAYRHDNPLFSTLRLADGTLTVFDLERCASMPRTVVLSACNVALDAAVGGGALLGLASSLMTFGSGTVIAPLTPVSDERLVPVMVRLHRGLLDGAEPARALALAAVSDDGLLDPTAASFVAFGA